MQVVDDNGGKLTIAMMDDGLWFSIAHRLPQAFTDPATGIPYGVDRASGFTVPHERIPEFLAEINRVAAQEKQR